MSETAHTPGPWSVAVNDIDGLEYASQLAVKEGIIRHTVKGRGEGFTLAVVVDDVVNGEANARLIAAAPELLEALQQCARFLGAYAMAGKTVADDENLAGVLESVNEALAKATGAA